MQGRMAQHLSLSWPSTTIYMLLLLKWLFCCYCYWSCEDSPWLSLSLKLYSSSLSVKVKEPSLLCCSSFYWCLRIELYLREIDLFPALSSLLRFWLDLDLWSTYLDGRSAWYFGDLLFCLEAIFITGMCISTSVPLPIVVLMWIVPPRPLQMSLEITMPRPS